MFWDLLKGGDKGKADEEMRHIGPFKVRPYRRGDRRRVLAITEKSFEGVCLDQNVEEHFGEVAGPWQGHKRDAVDYDLRNNPGSAFVALDREQEEVIGFVCNRLYAHRDVGHVTNLAVAPEWRRRGVAKALLRRSMDHFRAEGLRFARLETLLQNEKAQRLYDSLGFREIGRQIFYYKELDSK